MSKNAAHFLSSCYLISLCIKEVLINYVSRISFDNSRICFAGEEAGHGVGEMTLLQVGMEVLGNKKAEVEEDNLVMDTKLKIIEILKVCMACVFCALYARHIIN